MKNTEYVHCGNCGPLRNTPSCYSTCEHFRRRKERDAMVKKNRQSVYLIEGYAVDSAERGMKRKNTKRK